LPLVYGVLFLLGTGETLGDSVSSALVATSVESSRIGDANSRLFSTLIVTSELLGPPIGAFLFAAGAAMPFGVHVVLVLGAAVLLSRLARPVAPERSAAGVARRSVRDDIGEGLRWLWRHRGLRTLAPAILFMNITYVGAFATWVLFTQKRLGLPADRFGLMLAVTLVGALIGPLVYGRLSARVGAVWLLRVGLVIETLTHLALAVTKSVWVAGAVVIVFGVHAMVWGTVSTTVRQQATPAPLLGRVTSVYLLASVGGSAVGALLGGIVAQKF